MTRKIVDIVNNYAGSKIVTVEDGSNDGEVVQDRCDDVNTIALEPNTFIIVPEDQGAPVEPEIDPDIKEYNTVDGVDVGAPR